MKKKLTYSMAALAALLIGLLLAAPLVNDWSARRTAEGLRSLPLPERTELVETASAAAKLTGSGNGMQFFGAVLLHSELSLEELEAHYSRYARHDWECCVERQSGAAVRAVEHGSLRFDADVSGDGFYIVYSWGDGVPLFRELDLRGH